MKNILFFMSLFSLVSVENSFGAKGRAPVSEEDARSDSHVKNRIAKKKVEGVWVPSAPLKGAIKRWWIEQAKKFPEKYIIGPDGTLWKFKESL